MTNQMRFTPPSDGKNGTAADRALRGNMGSASFQQRGSAKAGLSRAEIIAQKTASEKRAAQFERIRAKMFPIRKRIARLSGSIAKGWHVTGQGLIEQLSFGELRVKLASLGYSDIMLAGRLQSLFRH